MADDDNPSAAVAAPVPSPRTAGAMLAQAREAAGLSVDQVAAQLKLAPRQVRALETGDFAALPGRTFVRGFVRNYARFLGIDTDSVLAALPGDDDPGLSHPHLANTHRVMGEIPAEHARRRSVAGWAIALALIAIIAVAVLYETLRPPWPGAPGSGKPAAPRIEPAPATPASPDGKALPNPMAPPGSEAAPSSGAATEATRVASAAADAVVQIPADTPASPAAATSNATPAQPAFSTVADTSGAATATKASTLQIIFRGTSWLDVKDSRGTSILTMTGNEGATRTLDAAPPLDLVVGNADHVDVLFRGARVDLAAHAKLNVARLQLR
ncbi:MAG: RodZ domain-containing protein [Betaproteobacteria bacterium]